MCATEISETGEELQREVTCGGRFGDLLKRLCDLLVMVSQLKLEGKRRKREEEALAIIFTYLLLLSFFLSCVRTWEGDEFY